MRVEVSPATGQLLIDGAPQILLAGELSNSAVGTASSADTVLPRLFSEGLNTVLMPVSWNQIEAHESTFDFRVLDHWIDVARAQHLHLVLLWFGA